MMTVTFTSQTMRRETIEMIGRVRAKSKEEVVREYSC